MHATYQAVLAVHIVAALISLGTFWVSAVARKGSALHVRVGAMYVRAMVVMAVSSLVMCAMNSADPLTMTPLEALRERRAVFGGNPWNYAAGDFVRLARLNAIWLAYLSVILLAGLRHGLQVVRTRRQPAANRGRLDIAIAAALAVSGPVILAIGVVQRHPVIAFFGMLGLLNGVNAARFLLRPPATPMAWFFQHMNAMLSTGVSLHVAALLALGRHLPGPAGSWRQLFPLLAIAAIPAMSAWRRYYRRRLEARPTTGSGQPHTEAIGVSA